MADSRSVRTRRPVKEFNELICCKLCRGYLIDATTLVECLHSFCRTCIISHLESNVPNRSNRCPSCDQQIHKTKPKDYIRSDPTLQDIVYKLVPGLYKNEMERRKEFYSREQQSAVGLTNEEKGEMSGERLIFTPEDHIYLSIEYFPQVISYSLLPYTKNGETSLTTGQLNGKSDGQRRYLKCEGAMRVIHLKKWLKNKYNIRDCKDIEIFYKYDPLLDDYTMIDLAYIFSWRRNGPLCLYYKIIEPKSSKKETKRLKPKIPSKVAKVPKVLSNGPKKVTDGAKTVKVASVKPNGLMTNGTTGKVVKKAKKVTNAKPKVMANGPNSDVQGVKDLKNGFNVSTVRPMPIEDLLSGIEVTKESNNDVFPSMINSNDHNMLSNHPNLVSIAPNLVSNDPKTMSTNLSNMSNNSDLLSNGPNQLSAEPNCDIRVASVRPKVKPTNKKRKSLNEDNLITTNPVNEPLPPVDSALMTNFQHMLSTAKKKKISKKKPKPKQKQTTTTTTPEEMLRLLCNSKVSPFAVSPFLFGPPTANTEPLNLCAPSKREPTPVPESPKLNGTDSVPPIHCNTI